MCWIDLCKYQSLDVFVAYFPKLYASQEEGFSFRFCEKIVFRRNLNLPLQVYCQSYERNLINLAADKFFPLIMSYLPRKQWNPFSFLKAVLALFLRQYQCSRNKNSEAFLENSIFFGSLFEWILVLLKCLSMSIVSVWSMKVISCSSCMFIGWPFTSCSLLFRW